ncbi:uncharacterized protein FA14DRAFT_176940 [Meira miltonrushii]|uniref:RING-type domain-containing protein n=1 Tax=Meira miltonrushii TaxID=1280837 RepID=A0A316VMM3_9BASI|nr:uncharacterized protein FA14DRAFT_176940 [Meira miltonrushii]PWN37653.1 hypothetical protein FA14DRAFT_176940 [Meira miltonrushii]
MEEIIVDWNEKDFSASEPIYCEICCTEDVKPEDQTKCAEGHIFCKTCAGNMAQVQINNFQVSLPCMSMKGCEAEFEEEEAKAFLTEVLYKKWKELYIEKFAKDLGIKEALEFCPFCDFNRVSFHITEVHTFICENRSCGKWSCLKCKEEDHSPLSCEEAERILTNVEDQKAKFVFEATVRRCPSASCGIAIEKDEIIAREAEAAEKEFEKVYLQQNFVKERKQALKNTIAQAREREHARLLSQQIREQEEQERNSLMQEAYLHKAHLPCLSSEDCKAQFGFEEAKKFLPEKLYDRWQKLSFQELMKALDFNEELCPFCDYACILTGAYDFGIFMCGNRQCAKWSCRTCRAEDHTPLTCQQSLGTLRWDDKRHIEKYLSDAIIRRCPNKSCFTPIEKAEGCNHMECRKCGTHFCYLCRKDISVNVYQHFQNSSCELFQDAEEVIAKEYAEAEERLKDDALQLQLKREALEDARKKFHAKQQEHAAKVQACFSREFRSFPW